MVSEITQLQARLTKRWHEVAPGADGVGLMRVVAENHCQNFLLWHEEDIARRTDVPAERIRDAKRNIDRYNQLRNNFAEDMDKMIIPGLPAMNNQAPQHSETPGMMIDRLSILALKAYHMREESLRTDASAEHAAKCAAKLQVIEEQLGDLEACLEQLVEDVLAGRRRIKVYYQFKMYNDPQLNPQLRVAAKD